MNPSYSFFVTGTDTEIGKTLTSAALLSAFGARGLRTAAMKPIAAGAEYRNGVWHNEDADLLADAANVTLPRTLTTPYLCKEACAPHLAARQEGIRFDIEQIRQCYATVAQAADCVVVEGVGGFRVPLDDHYDTADLACALKLPVVLVVGLRLGCLNHALLSAAAICASGLTFVGWVANQIDPTMRYFDENIATLRMRFEQQYRAPLLGKIPYLESPSAAAAALHLNIDPLLALCAKRL